MRSPSRAWRWLLRKECCELVLSRSWWVMLGLTGPLVGLSFIDAVRAYGEASGLGGTAAGLADAMWPLDGILAPTLSAYEVVALFLLPFVAIRMVAGDRQSGAARLEMQHSISPLARVSVKAAVLLGGWSVASAAGLLACILWKSHGGSIYLPEVGSIALGHLLNAGFIVALAAAAASISEHPSTAAILTLAFTVGTWVLSLMAAVHGDIWERLAAYTPGEMLQAFQHALIPLSRVLAGLALVGGGLSIAAVWMRTGVAVRRRASESIAIVAAGSALVFACSFVRTGWDVSENRRNSFSEPEEEILRRIRTPLAIEAHLAPEDPRRFELERQTLSKLKRIMPKVEVRYVSATSIGLFEQASPHYGEIRYDLGGRRAMNRITTSEGVLETIYELAGVAPPKEEEAGRHGHPLAVRPAHAGLLFYGIWPVAVAALRLFLKWRLV
ncbi:MAG TPA: hypothetical protein VE959_04410 [Bryobacteraceae bacterium]|nr:hypothetical protein [Bryobacteraceae bacterium]